MSASASPLPRFRRAIERGALLQAEAAARELGRLGLEDALRLLLLMHRDGDRRYERAALRFIGRVLSERSGLNFAQADALLDGLAELGGIASNVARARIAMALDAAGLDGSAKYVASGEDLAATEAPTHGEQA